MPDDCSVLGMPHVKDLSIAAMNLEWLKRRLAKKPSDLFKHVRTIRLKNHRDKPCHFFPAARCASYSRQKSAASLSRSVLPETLRQHARAILRWWAPEGMRRGKRRPKAVRKPAQGKREMSAALGSRRK